MKGKYIPLEGAPVYGDQPLRIEDIIDSLQKNHPEADVTLVQRAYIFAASAHQGMQRRSGEPYLIHPLAVAGILCDMKLDVPTVVAGLLHDTIEDTPTTLEDITQMFGKEVATIVDGVTKISQMNFSSPTERKATNMRKMIVAMLTDLRVILVKLADRLNNMRTLGFMPQHKQERIASETLQIFAPLASRLGIHKIQTELEDLCLFYLEPEAYSEIRLNLSAGRSDRQAYVTEVIEYLTRRIKEFKIKADIEGRPKHIYSIWKKMRDQNLTFDQLYDLTAFRIIVDSIQDCYGALGVIHSIFKAIPGRFKDYINLPKANGYQSLHTAVIGLRNTRMEIQIRTHDMHNYAENGVAAHWRYKDGSISTEESQRLTALRSILSWQENLDNPDAFLNSVRDTLAEKESIYVFTPAGDVKELPSGACPIDFAYAVHSMVGHNCVGAKVNGAIVPLRQKLQNGDTIEVLTSRHGKPSRDWLNYAVSSRAKARVRQWFAAEERAKAVDFGHDLLEKEMRRAGIPKARLTSPEVIKALGFPTLDELNAAVAFGKVSFKRILQTLAPEKYKLPELSAEAKTAEQKTDRPGHTPDQSKGILVSGQGDIFVRLAKCCAPIPGEPIIGYITQGHGVSVHSATCASLAGLDPDRFIDVSWSGQEENIYEIYFRVRVENEPGMLMKLVNLISPQVENIIEVHTMDETTEGSGLWFRLAIRNQAQFNGIVKSVKELPKIKLAERFFPDKKAEAVV